MNYQDWINAVAVLMPQPLASGAFNASAPFLNTDYNTLIPRCIEYVENKMYRDPDLNFIYTRKVDNTASFSTGSRSLSVPGGIIVVEEVAAFFPVGTTASNGTRVQFLPSSLDYINQAWPNASVTYPPQVAGPGPWFAMQDNTTIVVAPTPNAAYNVEVVGVYRPAELQQTASSTNYLTLNLPEMYVAASMIYWTGVMKDYGAQTDDPRMALSWTAQYEELKKGAAVESARQRAQGPGWTAFNPTTVATPPRN